MSTLTCQLACELVCSVLPPGQSEAEATSAQYFAVGSPQAVLDDCPARVAAPQCVVFQAVQVRLPIPLLFSKTWLPMLLELQMKLGVSPVAATVAVPKVVHIP